MTVLLAMTGAGLILILYAVSQVARDGRRLLGNSAAESDPALPDCVIVPGASYFTDGSPGLMLKDRLDSALALYRSGQFNRILVSGDHGGDDYDEISVMYNYLLAHGIQPEHILCDPAGFDTYETMSRAREFFHVRRAVVTTQTYHLLRALFIGNQLGLDIRGVACDFRTYPQMAIHRLREVPARFRAWLQCMVSSCLF